MDTSVMVVLVSCNHYSIIMVYLIIYKYPHATEYTVGGHIRMVDAIRYYGDEIFFRFYLIDKVLRISSDRRIHRAASPLVQHPIHLRHHPTLIHRLT